MFEAARDYGNYSMAYSNNYFFIPNPKIILRGSKI